MKKIQYSLTLLFSALPSLVFADEQTAQQQIKYQQARHQEITAADQHIFQAGSTQNFTGKVEFARYPVMPSQGDIAPAIVHFEANSITHWHRHKYGQYLIVIEGEGRIQEWGRPIQRIVKGDVIWCPPNVKHWHGASEQSDITHIAISPVSNEPDNVIWMEKVNLSASTKENVSANKVEKKATQTPVTLTTEQLSILPIAAFSAVGNLDKLRPALVKGLDNGLTVNQIKEIFAHQYAYAGFPRALNGMLTFRDVLQQRAKQGIQDRQGEQARELPKTTDYYQLGNETLAQLQNRPLSETQNPLFNNFSPTMDYALKAHLFGYLFSRNNLSPLNRELVVLATLSSLGGVDSQLSSHLRISQNLGVDDLQMQRLIHTLATQVGSKTAHDFQRVYGQLQAVQ